jgi:hypothetical protein
MGWSERLERGGPCRLLKLMQIGTQGVHKKGVLLWLVRWARHTGKSCLGFSSMPSIKYYFPHRTLFHFICPPIAQQAFQPVVPGHLHIDKCLWGWSNTPILSKQGRKQSPSPLNAREERANLNLRVLCIVCGRKSQQSWVQYQHPPAKWF